VTQWAKKRNIQYTTTSAKTGEGVNEAFYEVLKALDTDMEASFAFK
jgi:hypothetical protein